MITLHDIMKKEIDNWLGMNNECEKIIKKEIYIGCINTFTFIFLRKHTQAAHIDRYHCNYHMFALAIKRQKLSLSEEEMTRLWKSDIQQWSNEQKTNVIKALKEAICLDTITQTS